MRPFTIAGIPVTIHGSFFVMTLLLGLSRSSAPVLLVEWAVVVLLGVLLHELGHAFMARRFGLVPRIELHGMGGTTSYPTGLGEPPLTRARSAAISFAGPGAGFLLGGLVWSGVQLGFPVGSGLGWQVVRDLYWVNLGWGVFNLLPMMPLDGGHLLASLVGLDRARKAAVVVGLVLAVAALAVRWIFAAVLLGWLAIGNLQQLRSQSRPPPG